MEGVNKISKEGSPAYKKLVVIGGIVGFVAGFFPYKTLVNVLYGLNGYLGFILLAFMLVHDVRTSLKDRSAKVLRNA